MATHPADNTDTARARADAQPLALKDFLKTLNAARRHSSLYGSDHPSTQRMADDLAKVVREFLESFGPSTFVPTEDAVIVNDHWYEASSASRELFERLRSRGAMAFTLTGEPGAEQTAEFVMYLNAEPRDVRRQGGSSAYLRNHGVTKIVATDTVYVSEDDSCEVIEVINNEPAMDRAVAAVVTWLARQDEEDEAPRVRITDILADPDAAAKLIREAVTKLHVTSRGKRPSDLASQVIHELKDLASTNREEWDKATPQVRKAVAKLPGDMRPPLGGLMEDVLDIEVGGAKAPVRPRADASEVESAVNQFLEVAGTDSFDDLNINYTLLEKVLGAKSAGLLSNWRAELQPKSALSSACRTLSMLMSWESNSAEHGQICRSLATIVPRALGIGEAQIALDAAAALLGETDNRDHLPWRTINARTSLQAVEPTILRSLVEYALKASEPKAREIGASLVEVLPSVALAVVESIGNCSDEQFLSSLRIGIEKSGRAATPVLRRMLDGNVPANRWIALEVLIHLGTDWAVQEIAAGLNDSDTVFLERALDAVSEIRDPAIARKCLNYVEHKSLEVRCAALRALGCTGDESMLPVLSKYATRRAFRKEHVDEQIAAVYALGQLGGSDTIKLLDSIAISHSMLWRRKYEQVRAAAKQAADEIRGRCIYAHKMAA